MAYPTDKPSGEYSLRDYNFAVNDTNKLPMDEYLFKNGYKNAEESETESVPDAHNKNWLYDVLHRNLRYTQEVAEENKRQLETKLATPTTIGQVKIGYGLEVSSNGTLSVAKGIAEDANIISYDLPVGSYMLWAGNNVPGYFIEPAGQTLLRSAYPDLWTFAQNNGLVGKLFGKGDGSTTFTVTDIRGNFISIANSNDKVGKFTQAGLPNITGIGQLALDFRDHGNTTSGAMYLASSESGTKSIGGGDTYHYKKIGFDASRSNSTYGKSSTVTPANWGLKLILKALPTPPVNAVPTGTILTYTGLSAPDGYIVANGAELSRTTFSKLFNWASSNGLIASSVPSTAHGYFGKGNGSTTFTIPDMRGVFTRWGDLSSNRGGAGLRQYQADGLPNITGYIEISKHGGTNTWWNWNGALYSSNNGISGRGYGQLKHENNNWNSALDFNASRSNGIYGSSSYVQPKSVSLLPIIRY